MSLTIRIDDAQIRAWVTEAKDQLPFAAMVGMNRTGEEGLAAARQRVLTAFTVRRPQFILPPLRLPREWQATKKNPTVRIAIGDGGSKKLGERRRAILEKFEAGGIKTGRPDLPIAIPTTALRPTPETDIPQKLYPKYLVGQFGGQGQFLGLGNKARIRKGRRAGRGKQVGRYFVLGGPGDRNWGLYERTAANHIQMLWAFRTQVRIPARLEWVTSASSVIDKRLKPNMEGAIELALRTAFRKGTKAA